MTDRRSALIPTIADCVFCAVLLVITLVLANPALNTDGDAGRHLRVGEAIVEDGLPSQDVYSHTMEGTPFLPYAWLSEVLFAMAHRVGGLPAVVIFAALVIAAAWGLMALFLRRFGADPLLVMLVAAIGAAASAFHWLARPHVFTFVGVVAVVWLARPAGRARISRSVWLTMILFAIWANLHGAFLFGLVLIGFHIAGDLLELVTGDDRARWRTGAAHHSAMLVAAIIGSLINPAGPALLAHVTGYLGETYLVDHTAEYMSPDFHLWFGRAFLLVLVALVWALAHGRRRPSYPDMIVMVGTLAFALHSSRNIPLFCLTALPLMALHFDGQWRELTWRPLVRIRQKISEGDRQARAGGWAAGAAAAFVALAVAGGQIANAPVVAAGYDPRVFPVEAVRRARLAGLDDKMFNTFIWGGYILYAWPEQKIYIDGQTDIYGEALTREYGRVMAMGRGWRDRLAARGITMLLIPQASELAAQLEREPEWIAWHRDSTAVIFRRTGAAEAR